MTALRFFPCRSLAVFFNRNPVLFEESCVSTMSSESDLSQRATTGDGSQLQSSVSHATLSSTARQQRSARGEVGQDRRSNTSLARNVGGSSNAGGSSNTGGSSNSRDSSNAGGSSNAGATQRTAEQRILRRKKAARQTRREIKKNRRLEEQKQRRELLENTWSYENSPSIELVHLKDFEKDLFDDRARKHLMELKNHFSGAGMRGDSTVLDAFNILSKVAFEQQLQLTNRALMHTHNGRANRVTPTELRQWFGEVLMSSIVDFDADDQRAMILAKVVRCGGKRDSINFLPIERFRELTNPVNFVDRRVYAPSRTGMFRDPNKKTQELHKRARAALKDSLELFLTAHSVLTIGDWFSGLRGLDVEVESKSERKAATWGVVSDMICDVFFRYVIDVRHRERGHNADHALRETLELSLQDAGRNLRSLAFCADKRRVKEHFWRLLAESNSGFILMCDPVSSTTGHPFIGNSQHCRDWYPPQGRIPDGVLEDCAIFHATTNVSVADAECRTTPVYAYAVRTTRTISTKKVSGHEQLPASEILRFFYHGTGMEKDLRRTFVMVPQHAHLRPCASMTLFVPERRIASVASQELLDVEASLRTHVVARTYSRDATWCVLRRFHITGTVGAMIAKRGSANVFLSHEDDKSWHGQNAGSSVGPRARLFLPGNSGSSDGEAEELYLDADVIVVGSDRDDSCIQTETSEDEAWDSAEVDPSESDKVAVAKRLLTSWFSRNRSADDMKKGTKNDKAVMRALKAMAWSKGVWDVGLVAMKEHPWIAVSADGVARVQRPGAEECITVTLEIQSTVNQNTVARAKRIREEFGTNYWECEVPSEVWFRSVPPEYRGQLVHQAMVFGFEAALFVVASVTGIAYSVLVHVPDGIRQQYLDAMLAYKDVVAWAHDSYHPQVCCNLIHVCFFCCPLNDLVMHCQPPRFLPEATRKVFESNLPLWLAVMRKQQDELLPPLRAITTGLQVMNSRSKGEVDDATEYLASLQSSSQRDNWAQGVTMDVLLSLATNAVLMFRTWSVVKDLDNETEWPSLSRFREMRSRNGGFSSCMLELAARIMMDVAERNRGRQAQEPESNAPVEHLPYNPPRYNRRNYFNSDEGRRFRLSNRLHLRLTTDRQGRCIVCNRTCQSACDQCSTADFQAMLCSKSKRGSTTTCFTQFHSLTKLVDPRSRTPPVSRADADR